MSIRSVPPAKARCALAAALWGSASALWGAAPVGGDPPPPPPPASEAPARAMLEAEPRPSSALRLFAAVEEAWAASDAERLAALVDTASVRIALKPGAPPTAALTRSAAAFLFQDQLRLVTTRHFRVVRFEARRKGETRASAVWAGDWGGRQGVRDVRVSLTAAAVGGRWALTEVRASD